MRLAKKGRCPLMAIVALMAILRRYDNHRLQKGEAPAKQAGSQSGEPLADASPLRWNYL
jgi:hypothetical protein